MNSQPGDLEISNYRYNKDNILGKGSTGTVYLGSDIRTGNKVAIKIIDMKTIDNQVTTYLLNNQKKALNLLKHPNIVATYEIVQNAEYCFMIGEYCQGGTLYDYIKAKGRLTQKQAVEMLKGLVSGYHECVKFGITHRDLKPCNVLLKEGVPKIIDFGYAQIIGVQKPKIYYNVGSPSYMAPESILDNIYSQKSDIWSLGVSFYEMLTGDVPLDTKDVVKTFTELSKNGVKFPGYVSIFCREIINRCLIPNVEKRIDLDRLAKLLNSETEEYQPISSDIKRPVSELGQSAKLKSITKPPMNTQRDPNKNTLLIPNHQSSPISRQPVQPVPLKLSNQNRNQQELNSEYFTQANSKKLKVNQPPLQTQKHIPIMNPKNIEIKSPLISSSKHQQQMNEINRNSQKVLVRPVSMTGSLMLTSKASNSSINSLKAPYHFQNNQIPSNIINSGMRPYSPATNIVGHQVRSTQNLTNSLHNKVNIGNQLRPTVQHHPVKIPPSVQVFFKNYYS